MFAQERGLREERFLKWENSRFYMKGLIKRINKSKIIAITSILYASSLVFSYIPIDSAQATINQFSSGKNKINYQHFYNPMKFLQDNKNLREKANRLEEENLEAPSIFGFPTTG